MIDDFEGLHQNLTRRVKCVVTVTSQEMQQAPSEVEAWLYEKGAKISDASLKGEWSFDKYVEENVRGQSLANLRERDYTEDGELADRIDFTQTPTNMTPEDKLIWSILCRAAPTPVVGQEEEHLDYLSVADFTRDYKRYAKSFRRFKVTAEEFFFVLHEANKKNERIQSQH